MKAPGDPAPGAEAGPLGVAHVPGGGGPVGLAAVGLMSAAVALFAFGDACAKYLAPRIGPVETVWARYAGGVVFTFLVLNPWTSPGVLRSKRPGLQAIRSLLLFGATLSNFVALKYLPIATTTTIQFATPLAVALLAVPMLGERIGPRRIAAIGVGFVGVVVAARPGAASLHPAVLLSVLNVGFYALYNLATRTLAAHDSPATTLAWSCLAGMLLTTPFLPSFWAAPPDGASLAVMLLIGSFGTLGHWLLILAHRRAAASRLAPFIYGQLPWAVLLGWLAFGEVPDGATVLGGAIVVASGLYLLHRERLRAGAAG